MKNLYIIRHAQKNQEESILDDFDKPLTSLGEKQANNLGKNINELGIKPDLFVSSPALRAKTTAQIIAKQIDYKKEIVFNENIYKAQMNELKEIVSYTYDEVENLFLVGHNPSLTALLLHLTDFKEKFTMSSFACIEFDCSSWIDISPNNAKLTMLIKNHLDL